MSEQPFMPLWVADFIGDTLHLSADEVGQYILLLMAMWRAGGSLPADAKSLARIARKRVSEKVLCFFTVENDRITQKRLSLELAKARDFSEIQRKKAKARWGDNSLKDNKAANAGAMPADMPYHTHTHTHTHKEKKNARERASRLTPEFNRFWQAYPHKVGKAAAWKAFRSAEPLASLERILAGVDAYIAGKPRDRPWCNPATWLNQQRWLDQPAPVGAKRSTLSETLDRIVERAERHESACNDDDADPFALPENSERCSGAIETKDYGGRGSESRTADIIELSAKRERS